MRGRISIIEKKVEKITSTNTQMQNAYIDTYIHKTQKNNNRYAKLKKERKFKSCIELLKTETPLFDN
jgi:hypothetical protein